MKLEFRNIDINRFDELNIFFNDDFEEYKNKRIKQIINKECDVFVALYDDKYIGEITVKYINGELNNETMENVRVYLEAFRIKEDFIKQGIGQKLLNYVINYYIDKGYKEFTIGVEENNLIAKHIYEKFGFNKQINIGYDKEAKENYILYLKEIL